MIMEQINNLLFKGLESAAQVSIGQAVIRLIDKMMWVVEKSVQWSLPHSECTAEQNGKMFGSVELVRPLPWILFLPSLIILRIVRAGMNMGAIIFGYPKIQPQDMVRIMQTNRRRLRAIKNSGLRSMRLNREISSEKDSITSVKDAAKNLIRSIKLTLSTLYCLDSDLKSSPSPPPTKIDVSNILNSHQNDEDRVINRREALSKSINEDHADSKRKFSDLSTDTEISDESDDEPLDKKIDRLACELSSSDDEYLPNEDVSLNSSTSTENSDVNISTREIQDLKSEKEEMEKNLNNDIEKTSSLVQYENEQNANEDMEVEKMCTKSLDLENINDADKISNGVGTEQDTVFYSPVSWKSSPEQSISHDKKDHRISAERGAKPLVDNKQLNDWNDKSSESSGNEKFTLETKKDIATNQEEKKKGQSAKSNFKNKKANYSHRKKR